MQSMIYNIIIEGHDELERIFPTLLMGGSVMATLILYHAYMAVH